MATTKKNTKTTGKRKGGRRYMKKAARRTLAALLMITALIVAAIPATPSSAHNGGKDVDDIKNLSDTVSYNAPDGKTRFYFKRIQNPPIDDTLTFIGVAFLDSEGNELPDDEIRTSMFAYISREHLKLDDWQIKRLKEAAFEMDSWLDGKFLDHNDKYTGKGLANRLPKGNLMRAVLLGEDE